MAEPNVYVVANLTDPPEKTLAVSFATSRGSVGGPPPFVWYTLTDVEPGPRGRRTLREPRPGFEAFTTYDDRPILYPDQVVSYRSNQRPLSPIAPRLTVVGVPPEAGGRPTVWIPLPTAAVSSPAAPSAELSVAVASSAGRPVAVHFQRLGRDYVAPVTVTPGQDLRLRPPDQLFVTPRNRDVYEVAAAGGEIPAEIAIDVTYESAGTRFQSNAVTLRRDRGTTARLIGYDDPATGVRKLKLEIVNSAPPTTLGYALISDITGVRDVEVRSTAAGRSLEVPYSLGPGQTYLVSFETVDRLAPVRRVVTMEVVAVVTEMPAFTPGDTLLVKGNRIDGYTLDFDREA